MVFIRLGAHIGWCLFGYRELELCLEVKVAAEGEELFVDSLP